MDQVSEGGLNDNDPELESAQLTKVPIDDRVHDGLRLALWRLSEAKFKEALSDYNHKESARISTVDPNRRFKSFVESKPVSYMHFAKVEKVYEEKWVKFCKQASKWMSELSNVSGNWVEFDSTQETKILVSTEGSEIVQHSQIFSFYAGFRHLSKEGVQIEQELVLNCATQKELPGIREFKQIMRKKHDQLLKLMKARTIHSFSGPVLLLPAPAGTLFHEAIGHRLEGSRLLSSGEGQTFKGQTGKSVLNVELSIYDNPKLRRFKGRELIGSYDYDDEGTASKNVCLVENGVLRDFLTTRAAISTKEFSSNGHARNERAQRPISRMGVTIVKGKGGLTIPQLKEKLLEEIRAQNKPFGMIIYESSGGETSTGNYDFQGFKGEISYATLIHPDGSEVPVKGVNFIGTPLQALNNVIAYGSEQIVDNHYCGAESGMIPVTTISPAVLLRNLELQAKDEELRTQYTLPPPR